MSINKVAVIGSGVMGGGIAAQIANSGVPVYLFDIVPEGASDRSVVARTAIEKMKKMNPAPFMHKKASKLVTPCNLEDDLEKLSEVDWIVEVVVENLKIKHKTYETIEKYRKKDSIVSSNTSTIPLEKLIEGQSDSFKKDFYITHFFNPPRYLRLLEIVTSSHNDAAKTKQLEGFCDWHLGKTVVHCKDTPGFIANRIGAFWMQMAFNQAVEMDLTVEEADILQMGFGIPKTGVFGLFDLVGIDLMPKVSGSLVSMLPESDLYCQTYVEHAFVNKMIEDGYTGRKGKGGFYRLNRAGGKKVKESLSLKTGEYSVSVKPKDPILKTARKDIGAFLTSGHRYAEYLIRVFVPVFNYAASLVGEIADTIKDIDDGIKLGYNWKKGPFELIDQVGVDTLLMGLSMLGMEPAPILQKAAGKSMYKTHDGQLHYLDTDGEYQKIERREGVMLLSDIKLNSKPLLKNSSASLWDIGDGVTCLEFHSKMNSVDQKIMEMINDSVEYTEKNAKAMVVYNEGENFCVGANIGLALFAANVAAWGDVEKMVKGGQDAYMRMKHSSVPVVGAPSGLALGGGCEVLLHCNAVQAHAETYIGLVEVGVGVVPAWGGCKELLSRYQYHPKSPKGPMPKIAKVFETISTATVAKSAFEAQELMYFMPGQPVTMNRDRLLFDAKKRALSMVDGYEAPEKKPLQLGGLTAKAALTMAVDGFKKLGKVTPYDAIVVDQLSDVLSGKDFDMTDEVTEDQVLELELKAFMTLMKNSGTLARMESMLKTGKPLRN